MDVATVLERAADKLEPSGAWAKYSGSAKLGQKCALEAIEDASPDLELAREAADCLRKIIHSSSVGRWNDAPKRTQAEVVSALRSAAALARGEGS